MKCKNRKKWSFGYSLGNRGISIVGTVFTLIILGVLGASLVALVSMDQDSRMRSIHREYVFYSIQAAFEFALREINEGGYPIVTNKQFDDATFTVTIDPSPRKITAVANMGDHMRTYSITTDELGMDCLNVNMVGATVGGASNDELQNIVLTQTCLNAVTIESLVFSWSPDLGETVKTVTIDSNDVYDDISGTESGDSINITDTSVVGTSTINTVKFSSGISGKDISVTLRFTDSSTKKSSTVTLP